MNTVLRPAGPLPARVYWVRRLVLLAVVVLVGVVVWALVPRGGGGEDPAADGEGDPSVTAVPDDASGEDAADGEGGEDTTDGAPAPCSAEDLTVTLAADADSYGADRSPTFTVTFTNTGSQSCVVDAGAANQALVVTSGSDRIWSSADCPADGGTRTLLLAPGAQDQDLVAWGRVRSDETCSEGLPAPRPGTYTAVASLGGAQSGSVVFQLG